VLREKTELSFADAKMKKIVIPIVRQIPSVAIRLVQQAVSKKPLAKSVLVSAHLEGHHHNVPIFAVRVTVKKAKSVP
jgi:hypothetical protein